MISPINPPQPSNGNNDQHFMQLALAEANLAYQRGEVPVGAIIVDKERQVIASAHNQVIKNNDPTAHAEILAIRQACKQIQNYRLTNMTLYVTLEPCAMCASAITHARIQRLIFATRDWQAGACGSIGNLLTRNKIMIDEGVLNHECQMLLHKFFQQLRQNSKVPV